MAIQINGKTAIFVKMRGPVLQNLTKAWLIMQYCSDTASIAASHFRPSIKIGRNAWTYPNGVPYKTSLEVWLLAFPAKFRLGFKWITAVSLISVGPWICDRSILKLKLDEHGVKKISQKISLLFTFIGIVRDLQRFKNYFYRNEPCSFKNGFRFGNNYCHSIMFYAKETKWIRNIFKVTTK